MLYNKDMQKKKIAVLTSGWSIDYILSVFDGMKKACEGKNIDLYIFSCYKFSEPSGESNTTGFAIFNLAKLKDFDGVVIMPNLFNDPEQVKIQHKRILEAGIPAVSLNEELEGLHFINSENHNTYRDLILHLINHHGFKRLAYLGGPENNPGAESNYEAYREALKASGIRYSNSMFIGSCDWSYESALVIANEYFDKVKKIPEAIVCVNDWAAMAVITAAIEHGYSVPEDIKVIGCDEISYSDKVYPSITTLSIQPEKIGQTAIELLLEKPKTPTKKIIESIPKIRQSCGCTTEITQSQIKYGADFYRLLDHERRISSHLRHLEDTFITHETVKSLSDNLQEYFEKRHPVEGSDFAILINQNVVNSLKQSIMSPKESSTFDETLLSLANIEKGKPVERFTVTSKEMIPENMKSKESTMYLFLPIFNQKYIHGYYVAKNSYELLKNKTAYNWTRNFGTIIEKYRQTSIYRMLSEQMKFLSTQDSLSGLFNRAGLKKYGSKLFEKNLEEGNPTQIIFVDINSMKTINDKFGHLQGDLAVKTVAEAISFSIPSGYIAVRYGGDEFVIIGTAREDIDVCQKINETLAQRVVKMTLPYNLTVSLGSKIFVSTEKSTMEEAIKEVDEVMYINKTAYHKTLGLQ